MSSTNKTSSFIIHNLWWLIPLSVVLFFWQHAFPILLMLVFAYLGRVILNPMVKLIDGWIYNRKWSVFIVIIMLIILLAILSGSVFPLIWDQILSLQSVLSMESLVKFQSKLTLILEGILPTFLFNAYNDFMVNVDVSMSDMWEAGLSQLSTFIGSAGTVAFALGSAILSFLILLVFMIFFLLDGEKFTHSFMQAVPEEKNELIKRMLNKTSQQIHAYIRGQLLAGTSVAITSIIGLYVLQWITGIQIPYTILIGIVAGLFNLIPFIGPVMGMIPAIVIYLVTDQVVPIHILYVFLIMVVFAIVQLIDNLIMSPYIMGSSVGFHPMLVIMLVLLGASIGGILGMLGIIFSFSLMYMTTTHIYMILKKGRPGPLSNS